MSDTRFGARVRAVRVRLGWRQEDVSEHAGVSQDLVSDVELGRLDALKIRSVRAVLRALDMELGMEARWRGGDIDRLTDAGHAALVARIIAVLLGYGWIVQTEVSFAVYGERGSIDVLAWHPEGQILLVVEVKTTLNSVEETLRRQDVKVRLAPGVARERFGWAPAAVARLLVLPDDSTARRRVATQAQVLGQVYPDRGLAARRWLRAPSGSPGLLLFLPLTLGERGIRRPVRRQRVRVQGRAAADVQARPASVDDAGSRDTTPPGRK